jgi:HSP20 family protein
MWNLPDRWRVFDRPLGSLWNDPDHSTLPWNPYVYERSDSFAMTGRDSVNFSPTIPMIPPCDVDVMDELYLLSLDMPGLEKEDIDLEIDGKQLLIWGEHRTQRYRAYQRIIILPEDVRTTELSAEYSNGVLRVAVPRSADFIRHHIRIRDRAETSDSMPVTGLSDAPIAVDFGARGSQIL